MHKYLIIVFAFLINYPLYSQSDRFGIKENQNAIIPDAELIAEDSSIVKLSEIVDKPTILSFVYYRCPGLCSPLMEGIAEVIDLSNLKIGKDYQVVTISIDERETPELARKKKQNYINLMEKKEAADYWKFFTADKETIKKLTDVAGFEFKKNGEDFVHSAAIIVLTPDRKISQYLYGTYYLPMHFTMGIMDAYEGKSVPTRVKVLKYCYNFVPNENQNVIVLARTGGLVIALFAVGLFLFLVLQKKFKKKEVVVDE